MKGLAIGDYFVPKEIMVKAFDGIKEYLDEIASIEWEGKDRADVRRKVRNIEKNGIEYEDPPVEIYSEINDADILVLHNCPISRRVIESS